MSSDETKKDTPSPNETVVISSDNPLLKRILNKQAHSENEDAPISSELQQITFSIRGMTEQYDLKIGTVIKLGRYDLSKDSNELDLNPYGASMRGVSHNHAEIHMDSDGIYIKDLGSTNGTFIHGKRLDPHTLTLLQKDTEILFGRLKINVTTS